MLKRYQNQAVLLTTLNHANVIRAMTGIRTVGQAYESGSIKLSQLREIYQPETPTLLVETWLNQLVAFLGLPLNDDQLRELAWMIYEEAHFLNLKEVALFMYRVKRGHYGQFFGRIDPAAIMRWLREFRAERGQYLAKLPDNYQSTTLARAKREFYENQHKS